MPPVGSTNREPSRGATPISADNSPSNSSPTRSAHMSVSVTHSKDKRTETPTKKIPLKSAKEDEEEKGSEGDDLGPDFGEDLDREPGFDERLEWMKARIRSSLSSAGEEKLYHFFKDEDALYPCREFMDHDNTRVVFVYAGEDGKYIAATSSPKQMKGKGLYFIKMSPGRVRMETIYNQLMVHDFDSVQPLQQVLMIAQEIYYPMISNGKNQEGWPEVITKEVTDNLNRFLANSYITVGQIAGSTILPLPAKDFGTSDANASSADSGKDRVHLLENAVVTWTRQIKNILKLEPEQMFKGKHNPGPGMEVEFWTNKAANFNSIYAQLNGPKIRKVMDVLESSKSTYFPSFDRLCKEVAVARDEANDTLLYLRPANRYFQLLLDEDFMSVNQHFRCIMHITLIVWKTSRFYNTPSRLVVLIREMCNDIIRQACAYMAQGETKWYAEPKDSVWKLKKIIEQALDFKETYYLYRHKSIKVCPQIPWNFQSSTLFGRLDSFLERSHDVLDLMQTLTQFKTLEYVEIGGTKGKSLTSSVHQIFADFQRSVLVFQEAQYNMMDIDTKQFDDHFYIFRTEVNELERRLASVIIQAFDDSTSILGSFKLLDSFEKLLEREILHSELQSKQAELLKEYLQDIAKVQEIFSGGKKDPPVGDNFPPHAGAVAWVRGLLRRIEEPMHHLRQMSKIVLDADEGREVEKMFGISVKILQEYERNHIGKWAKDVSNTSEAKLKLPLLRREDGDLPLLHVNFDPDLVCLLREVKYFLALGVQVPGAAMSLYQNEEVFRVQTGNLSLIVNLYNQIMQTLLDVEKPLVQQKMDNIDKVLQRGLLHMNWKSHTITDFISQCTAIVKELHSIVHIIKSNVVETCRILNSWSQDLLLERKLTRTYAPEEFTLLQKELEGIRYRDIIVGSEKIHSFLGVSQKTLRANRGSAQFKAYINHVNRILIDGLAGAVLANCEYLLRQVDDQYLIRHDVNPLLEVQLRLQDDVVVFSPELGRTKHENGIGDLVFKWINSFCNIGMLVRRMDTPTPEGNYLADVQENRKVKHNISVINSFIRNNVQAFEEYRFFFQNYSYLWLDDVTKRFEYFLLEETQQGEVMPPVYAFEENIHNFRMLKDEIRELSGTKVIGWLKIDVRPLRSALLTCVSKWNDVFQQYPLNHVIKRVNELVAFVAESSNGISLDVIDTETLITVLTHLLAIKKRESEIDVCFEPLRSILQMLAKQEVQLPPDLNRELITLQEDWISLKLKAIVMKDRHSLIAAKEAKLLKERGNLYEGKLDEFRKYFLQTMPFNFSENVDKAYATIDLLHHGFAAVDHHVVKSASQPDLPVNPEQGEHAGFSVVSLYAEMLNLNRLQECFEMDIVDYVNVEICMQDSALLKVIWDAISHVLGIYARWRQIRWVDVNIKILKQENEWLVQYVETLDPRIHKWQCHGDLLRAINDMHKTFPLIEALNHFSMRARHWKQLMRATGHTFETDERFCLGDLLSLKLHFYEREVLEIVDRAQNEEQVELQLSELDKAWSYTNLAFELYFDDPLTNIIRVDDLLLDNLKQHIALVQTMQNSKYVQSNNFFLEKVIAWQQKLGMVDNTIVLWMAVQTKWCHLRSIYLDSSDIKEKLPDDTKSFMEINLDWKSLMKESGVEPNVIKACNIEGRQQRLDIMLAALEVCERALSDYLESKRTYFPRFYFLCDVDLLDILSKGKYPRMISKHLKACLDGVVSLKFMDGELGLSETTSGVFSPEGEYLEFCAPFECTGDVEGWLLLLTEHIQKTIETTLSPSAMTNFTKMEKRDFVFHHCAQIACIVLRINFCQKVSDVLDLVEHGNVNALESFALQIKTDLDSLIEFTSSCVIKGDRIKISTVITSEIHQRDLMDKFIADRVDSRNSFAWNSQIRHRLNDDQTRCMVNICNYERFYGNEYIGNCGCLISTPLTERTTISLTQAVRLYLGGALTGAAGTGKSEITKDLARCLGLIYYIFNCSDQITSTNIGFIFKGLAQLGAWACLDEFNRIKMPVLSVASSQLKAVLDAQKAQKSLLTIQGSVVKIDPKMTSSVFITMYQDYDRAVEIPESLRALFRPCAMVQPETEHIAEVLLTSEGFSQCQQLARKCVTLYTLSESLLSGQHYYDWHLRAVKTAILVAGENRRSAPYLEEELVLMTALRDFNLARLVHNDVQVFVNLLKSLFPNIKCDVSKEYGSELRDKMFEACRNHALQPVEGLMFKAFQLRDILSVRSAVYILGPALCGKSSMLRMLSATQNLAGERTSFTCLNPKAVHRDELFGHLQADTNRWKDGILTHAFRDFADHRTVADSQMLVLDGDIDPEWIESMHTVMDENKTLTLASGERIPLTPTMKLVFETASLQHASPTTISRGGVVYVNDSVVGWTPYAHSWVNHLMHETEKLTFQKCMEKYVPVCLEFLQDYQTVVPLPQINLVISLCHLLEALIGNGEVLQNILKSKGEDDYILALESLFAYATVWGLGGSLADDKVVKTRAAFDKFWRETFLSSPTFPEEGSIFEYFFDKQSCKYVHWNDKSTPHTYVPNLPFRNIYVPSPEGSRHWHVLGLLIHQMTPVMLVGTAGTGKTAIVKERIRSITQIENEITTSSIDINFNSYTNSRILQSMMESGLEKRTGRTLGPRGCKKLIYFVDDLNMPQADKYGTQQPIALLLQYFAYKYWFDRQRITTIEVHDVQFVSCMNPSVGSFTVDPRFHAGFATFAVQMPAEETMFHIYSSIVQGHFSSFEAQVQKVVGEALIYATVNLYKSVSGTFTATPAKMQYVFNMRDISAVTKGLCCALRQYYSNPPAVIRLWAHECERVFCDRLASQADIEVFQKMLSDFSMKWCDDYGEMSIILAKPLIYTTFCSVTGDEKDPPYCSTDLEKLTHVLEEKLAEYNESHAIMKLVLFDEAILHVCRIARIIGEPSGNALLVGTGGSGKQSLAKLSAFICGYEVLENASTLSFDRSIFANAFKTTQLRAGKENCRIVHIITDRQITDETMLILINDFLSSGNLYELYTTQEKYDICDALRPKVQAEGIIDTIDNCWEFYLETIRRNFHLCLCFSPSHEKFRTRCKQFPALLNSTCFDYFHPWQSDSLVAVAERILTDIELKTAEGQEAVANHLAFVHSAISTTYEEFYVEESRHNYTTPKCFLDFAELFKDLLQKQRLGLKSKRERLLLGLHKLQNATSEISILREQLLSNMEEVKEKTDASNSIMKDLEEQTRIADAERFAVSDDEARCRSIQAECSRLEHECKEDFKQCEPILEDAERSLETLDKKNLTELKSLPSPPTGVDDVLIGVMILTAKGAIPKDLSWASAKKVMANVDQFIKMLQNLDKENIPDAAVGHCEKVLLTKDTFNPDRIRTKSTAASGLCSWVINICQFHKVFKTLLPKKRQLEEATQKLSEVNSTLSDVRARLQELDDELSELTLKYQEACNVKEKAEKAALATEQRVQLSDRLTITLSDEETRWLDEVELIRASESFLLGNVLLSSAFVSYIGVFNSKYRAKLITIWRSDVQERGIQVSDPFHPNDLLINKATIARWTQEGLPADSISHENAVIITSSLRCPLVIDPQLQAIWWLKSHCRKWRPKISRERSDSGGESKSTDAVEGQAVSRVSSLSHAEVQEVTILRMNQASCLEQFQQAVALGECVIIENLGEDLDPVIESVLSRAIIKSANGRQMLIRLGERLVEYNPNFVLYLHTKLANPHFKPEIAAQTTIVNFTITPEGLKEQLLTIIMKKEQPELYEQRIKIIASQNSMHVHVKELEDTLLESLSSTAGDILSNVELITGMEQTKLASKQTAEEQGKLLSIQDQISVTLDEYLPIANRGVLTYFLIDSLFKLNHLYHFSLAQCIHNFTKGLDLQPDGEVDEEEERRFQYNLQHRKLREKSIGKGDVKDEVDAEVLAKLMRMESLKQSTCLSMYLGVSRGLLQNHKLIFATELCFRTLIESGSLNPQILSFLIQEQDESVDIESPLKDWLDATQWQSVLALSELEISEGKDEEGNPIVDVPFANLRHEMVESSRRFRDWHDFERPEEAQLPGVWKTMPDVQKLLLIRALRPDRLIPATYSFVKNELGYKFMLPRRHTLKNVMQDCSPQVPILFILTPGVDPVKDVEALGEIYEIHVENKKLALVCLGEGQEAVAESTVEGMIINGGWVFLQNLHLLKAWTNGYLEDTVENISKAHETFRLFLSTEPSFAPIAILKSSIKLANEAPDGLQANILKAMQPFDDTFFEQSNCPSELKAVMFGICVCHAVLVQRKTFGPIGWNQPYPFNVGDLNACSHIAKELVEENVRIPWQELRFMCGDVIYGGHMTDLIDRSLLNTYLESFVCDELMSGFEIVMGMNAPSNWDMPIEDLLGYVQRSPIRKSPVAIGLNNNVEIVIMLNQGKALCRYIDKLHTGAFKGLGGGSVQERAGTTINEVSEKMPTRMVVPDSALAKSDEVSQYVLFLQQEVISLNNLLKALSDSMSELQRGLLGELQLSDEMEDIMVALADNRVPRAWEKVAYPSLRSLGAWVVDLGDRARYLRAWCHEPNLSLPKVTWLPALFAPKTFLTVVQQFTANRNGWALDRTSVQTEVTKKTPEEIGALARDGAYITGLFLEGATWDNRTSSLEAAKGKELEHEMPVILVKAIQVSGKEKNERQSDVYDCPVYKTRQRGSSYIWRVGLRSKVPTSTWVMAGVGLIMEI